LKDTEVFGEIGNVEPFDKFSKERIGAGLEPLSTNQYIKISL
jgi:hypothetical protein